MRKSGRKRLALDRYGGARLICKKSMQARDREALDRPLTEQEAHMLVIPARVSLTALLEGRASIDDVHNIVAFLNVGLILAHNIQEFDARNAVQEGIFAMASVRARPGPTYAMNADQRTRVVWSVDLTDELFGVSTLLELTTAHRKVLSAIPLNGSGNLIEVKEKERE